MVTFPSEGIVESIKEGGNGMVRADEGVSQVSVVLGGPMHVLVGSLERTFSVCCGVGRVSGADVGRMSVVGWSDACPGLTSKRVRCWVVRCISVSVVWDGRGKSVCSWVVRCMCWS